MLHTFDVAHYLSYPFKGQEAQKNFLLGSLIMLASFFIPILPLFIVYGYLARIMKQVLEGEKASMPAWDDWNGLLMDGLRLYGVRIIYTLPLLVVMFTALAIYFGGMFFILAQDELSTNALVGLVMAFMCVLCLTIPLGLALSILAYPAGAHTVAKGKFSAGFNIGEWWPILRKNLVGFLLMIGATYLVSFIMSLILQILYFTIILACLMPILMPIWMFYMVLVVEPMAAQAYREGRERLTPGLESA